MSCRPWSWISEPAIETLTVLPKISQGHRTFTLQKQLILKGILNSKTHLIIGIILLPSKAAPCFARKKLYSNIYLNKKSTTYTNWSITVIHIFYSVPVTVHVVRWPCRDCGHESTIYEKYFEYYRKGCSSCIYIPSTVEPMLHLPWPWLLEIGGTDMCHVWQH